MSNVASGTTSSPRGRRTLRLLVGAEFALAALLLVCGGLLMQAFARVRQVDPGFEPRGVLTFGVYLPAASYSDDARLEAEGEPPRGAGEKNPVVLYRFATEDYFRAMGVRLRAGRLLEASDGRAHGGLVAVANEAFVREFLPGEEHPVGRRIRRPGSRNADSPWTTIVGVVADVKHYGLERPMRPGLYLPLPAQPADTLTVALKTQGRPESLVAGARAAVRELDPDLALYQVRTMEQALRRSTVTRATYSWLLAVFALLALVLALGGTYGVTGYLASQRTREMGIRVALGAQAADIRRSVLRGSLAVVGVGMALGAALSLGAARLLSGLLVGVPPHDPVVLLGTILLLGLTALAASWLPAVRASRADPMATLRTD